MVSAEEARARFARHLDLAPLPAETVALAAALGRVLAHDVGAPIDVPPFDRANVDGFAVRAADIAGATDTAPRRLALNAEVVVCGHAPAMEVAPGSATTIATGGVVPRGADAVVMIEHTELLETMASRRSTCAARPRPDSSSPMPAPTSRAARWCCGAARASARARSACWRPAASPRSMWCAGRGSRCSRPATSWWRRAARWPRQGLSTATARSSRRRSPKRAASRSPFGAFPDDEAALELAMRTALADLRHGRALGRHLERRGRSLAPGRVAARLARHPRARRRAQARQAALPCGARRQAARGAAGLPDLGDLHLPCLRRAGDPRAGRAAAGSRAHASRPKCRCASPPSSAARNSCWSRWSRARTARSRSRRRRARARSRASRRPTAFSRSTRCRARSTPARVRVSR